jgi:hypothetical protein
MDCIITGSKEPMHETQETIGKWAIEKFGRPRPLAVLRRSVDELLEAIELTVVENEATRTMFKAMRLGLKHLDNYELGPDVVHRLTPEIMMELADSEIVNKHAAESMHCDLQSFIDKKMEINRARLWKMNGDGTGQHTEEKHDERETNP